MKRDDSVYLRHILDAIAKIETYLQGVDEQAFLAQSLLQDGAIRQIEIIGEAVKQLSQQLRDQHPHIPWQDIARMRDKLIHQYL
ncbi:MAG: HepT-like ribonuclease domain-containing protein [Blastocatellia bacterium]